MYKIELLFYGYSLETEYLDRTNVKNFIKFYYGYIKSSEILIKNILVKKEMIKGFKLHGDNIISTSDIDIEPIKKEAIAEALFENKEDDNNE